MPLTGRYFSRRGDLRQGLENRVSLQTENGLENREQKNVGSSIAGPYEERGVARIDGVGARDIVK